jgi:hypothetical protein
MSAPASAGVASGLLVGGSDAIFVPALPRQRHQAADLSSAAFAASAFCAASFGENGFGFGSPFGYEVTRVKTASLKLNWSCRDCGPPANCALLTGAAAIAARTPI